MNRAHLVSHRADAADAGGDIRGFAKVPPAQQCLEEARRLEYLKAHVGHPAALDLDVQATLALDTGQVTDIDGFSSGFGSGFTCDFSAAHLSHSPLTGTLP